MGVKDNETDPALASISSSQDKMHDAVVVARGAPDAADTGYKPQRPAQVYFDLESGQMWTWWGGAWH